MESLGLGIIIMGAAFFFNIMIILKKTLNRDWLNAGLDLFILLIIMRVTGGSTVGIIIGTIASALFSVYLMYTPLIFADYDVVEARRDIKREKMKRKINRQRAKYGLLPDDEVVSDHPTELESFNKTLQEILDEAYEQRQRRAV